MESNQLKRLRDDEELGENETYKKPKDRINPNHLILRPPQVIRNIQNSPSPQNNLFKTNK